MARKHPKFWRTFWNIGVVMSFIFMIGAVYFFVSNFISLIFTPKPENALLPLIPGVTVSFPMFSYLIIPLLINITFHEFSHGIAAETDNVDTKSSGVLGAGIFFILLYGAFVEVDEFQLYSRKYSSGTRLRVAAGGTWANTIIAGIFFLLFNGFAFIMSTGYYSESVQLNSVLSTADGGFNENLLHPGDILYQINGTTIDANSDNTLSNILNNQTSLKINFGDDLEFNCYNPDSKEFYSVVGKAGFRSYVGFSTIENNNTSFKITEIIPWVEGGNNYGIVEENMIVTQVNGTSIDYDNGITMESILTQTQPNYTLVLSTSDNQNISIYVNFLPKFPNTFNFPGFFMGIDYEEFNNSIIINNVFENATENGINEGRIPEGINITKINGVSINLESLTLKQFMAQFSIQPGDSIVFESITGETYLLQYRRTTIL